MSQTVKVVRQHCHCLRQQRVIAGIEVVTDRRRDVIEGLRGVTVPRCESRQVPGVVRLEESVAGFPRNLRS